MYNNADILRELETRVQAHHNGALVFFHDAGVPLTDDREEIIMLQDLRNLLDLQPAYFEQLIHCLYGNEANAGGSFDYLALIAGVLGGASQGLMANSTRDADLAQAQSDAQIALAQQQAEANKRTMLIVLGIMGVLVVAAVIVFARKRH